MAAEVAVVVVSWNGGDDLRELVASIRRQTLPPAEVVVVDNGSSDGTPEWLSAEPGVQLLRHPYNFGFAAAANRGVAATRSPLILLCNQDVVLDPEFLEAAGRRLGEDPRAGSVGGRLRRLGSKALDSTGHLLHSSGWVSNRGQGQPDDGRYGAAEEVFGVSAAAALYRREMLEDVAIDGEVFCEAFFSYLEDVDLDWRARWRGWHSWYEPGATAAHRRGGSGLHRTASLERHVLANRVLLLVRNAPAGWWSGPRVIQLLGLMAMRLGLALGRHPASTLGIWDAALMLSEQMRVRRRIRGGRLVGDRELERWVLPTPWRDLVGRHLGCLRSG